MRQIPSRCSEVMVSRVLDEIAKSLPVSLAGCTFDTQGPTDLQRLCTDRGGRYAPEASAVDVFIITDLHHLRNPLAALDLALQRTRQILLIHAPKLRPAPIRSSALGWRLLGRHPAMAIWPAKRRGAMPQAFWFTPEFFVQYLKGLRQDVSAVTITDRGAALVVSAQKRSIGKLTILAGLPAIGKSTFLKAMLEGTAANARAIRDQLDLTETELATFTSLLEPGPSQHDRLLVQYNITAPLTHGPLYRYEYVLADLIRCARKPQVVTMWLPAKTLLDRYLAERVPGSAGGASAVKQRKSKSKHLDLGGRRSPQSLSARLGLHLRSRHMQLKDERFSSLYANGTALKALYDEWFSFLDSIGCKSDVLLQEPDYRLITQASWQAEWQQT